MLTIVLILNMLIAGLCWYGVWRIWQFRQALVRVTAALTLAEQDIQQVLQDAVYTVRQGQTGTTQLRQQYQQVLRRLQQVQQVIGLLGLGQLIWRQYKRQYPQYRVPHLGVQAPFGQLMQRSSPQQPHASP
jgi:hypothetical protein